MYKVFIDGKEGTTGLRIYERLGAMDDIELLVLAEAERKDIGKRTQMINQSDVAFLCLPDEAARESAAAANSDVRIIDTSTAHRTDPAWNYGFPELSKEFLDGVKNGKRVCVPGCHASGFIALVFPLVRAGIISKDAALACFSLTGYSGGGKKMIAEYEDQDRAPGYAAPRQYAFAQTHKHIPEMAAVTGLKNPPVFCPVVGDFYNGMIVSVPLGIEELKAGTTPQEIASVYQEVYANKGVMHPMGFTGDNNLYAANELAGNDSMYISVEGNSERICLVARFDNLGKGASGAAVQCMNLMLGRDEFAGLEL
jgi:N-acetyl-gamma-glutamyl-phosphate reductase, uncommon form